MKVVDGYWTLSCEDCQGKGWFQIVGVRHLRRMRAPWWRWPADALVALKRRQCTPCKGTGRVLVCLAAPR